MTFLSTKAWHPSTKKNQMKKLEAEQQFVKSKKLQEQYAKQILQERAELEEKRRQEEERQWVKQQIEQKEKERKSFVQMVNKNQSQPQPQPQNQESNGPTQSKKTRRGKKKPKQSNVEGRSATEILSSMGVLAKRDNCDFMYMPPPGLKEAQEKLEKPGAQSSTLASTQSTKSSPFTTYSSFTTLPSQSSSNGVKKDF